MAITCYPVASTWVAFVIDLDGALAVQFRDGFAARYAGTDGSFVTAMLCSASKGRFVGTVLKRWPYTPIAAPCPCEQTLEAAGSKGTFILTGYEESAAFQGSTATGFFTLVGDPANADLTLVVSTGTFTAEGFATTSAISAVANKGTFTVTGKEARAVAARVASDYAASELVTITARGNGDVTVRWPDGSEETMDGGGEFQWTSNGPGLIQIFGELTEFLASDALQSSPPFQFGDMDFLCPTLHTVRVPVTNITTLDLSRCASVIFLEAYHCVNLTSINFGGNAAGDPYCPVNECAMEASDLDAFFTSLGSGTTTIEAQNNPGSLTCDPSIAEGKGYTVEITS